MSARGEFKTPGGKLVAVEFTVREQALRDVMITGDFFLYPEDALPLLSSALEGVPIDSEPAEIADRVRAVLGQDIELLGSSPEAIATAIMRALGREEGSGERDGR